MYSIIILQSFCFRAPLLPACIMGLEAIHYNRWNIGQTGKLKCNHLKLSFLSPVTYVVLCPVIPHVGIRFWNMFFRWYWRRNILFQAWFIYFVDFSSKYWPSMYQQAWMYAGKIVCVESKSRQSTNTNHAMANKLRSTEIVWFNHCYQLLSLCQCSLFLGKKEEIRLMWRLHNPVTKLK